MPNVGMPAGTMAEIARYIHGHAYLAVVDTYTKRIEVCHEMQTIGTCITNVWQSLLATCHVPKAAMSNSETDFALGFSAHETSA